MSGKASNDTGILVERAGADQEEPAVTSRRGFLKLGGTITAMGLGGGSLATAGCGDDDTPGNQPVPSAAEKRRSAAYELRVKVAAQQRDVPLPEHTTNGDDQLYANRIASFTKCLRHNDLGEVDSESYGSLLRALGSGNFDDFNAILLGGTGRLINPQASYAFSLEGGDPAHFFTPPPPAFASPEMAAEMIEVYWRALARDVPFSEYSTAPIIQAAAAELSGLSGYAGPKVGSSVTPEVLFRSQAPGDTTGPFISQFLWADIPYGSINLPQRYAVPLPGNDFVKSEAAWLALQREGRPEAQGYPVDSTQRYIRSARDLGVYVHRDFSLQPYLGACLYLFGVMATRGPAVLHAENPYWRATTQFPTTTFGEAHISAMLGKAVFAARKAVMYQKWLVHRRIRPEAFAGRVHHHLAGNAIYPLHSSLTDSAAVSRLRTANGTAFLPLAYPEGSPTHPSYPAAHAATAGACITILKAFFNENYVLPAPVVPSADGLFLEPYSGSPLTVGGELNKLASNISHGRDFAGVHFRSDGFHGMRLGEDVAISLLRDWKETFNEGFSTTFTRLDGTVTSI